MTDDALAPVADKLKHCIRLLASDRDGEVVAAARALHRTLQNARLDFHALADRVTQVNGLDKAQMRKIYDAGHAAGLIEGRRAAEKKLAGRMFQNVDADAEPSWFEIASECRAHPQLIRSDRERQFLNDMCRRLAHGGMPGEKEGAWLRKIYARLR
jgi:hypothetical protein